MNKIKFVFRLAVFVGSVLSVILLNFELKKYAVIVFAAGCCVIPLYCFNFSIGYLLGLAEVVGDENILAMRHSWLFKYFPIVHPGLIKVLYGGSLGRKYDDLSPFRTSREFHFVGVLGWILVLFFSNIS